MTLASYLRNRAMQVAQQRGRAQASNRAAALAQAIQTGATSLPAGVRIATRPAEGGDDVLLTGPDILTLEYGGAVIPARAPVRSAIAAQPRSTRGNEHG